MREKRLHISPARCIGCKTCELACAFAHMEKGKIGRSRINVYPIRAELNSPVVCLQCEEAACVASCKFGAIERNAETGAIIFDYEKCVGCSSCLGACPFGNIALDPHKKRLVKCDLCGGEPMCAQFCPTQTLEYK
jgi:carbon-monoxide dehydrogenase iron sulfur subunit